MQEVGSSNLHPLTREGGGDFSAKRFDIWCSVGTVPTVMRGVELEPRGTVGGDEAGLTPGVCRWNRTGRNARVEPLASIAL